MSCACSTPATPVKYGSACTTTGSGTCPAPRRVATPSVTPVVFAWVDTLRQAYEGQLLMRNGTELMVLDAPFSGQLFFDVNTSKISVSSYSANSVEDQYACDTKNLSGFPVYGLNPGCRNLGENPDRALAVLRPEKSNKGFLYAHNRVVSVGPGLEQEITPVEIDPATFTEENAPSGLKYLSFRRTGPTDDGSPPTLEWFESQGIIPIDVDKLPTTTVTLEELTDTTQAFNFLVTRLVDEKWQAFRLTNESFKKIVSDAQTSTITWLTEPRTLLHQWTNYTTVPGRTDVEIREPYSTSATIDLHTIPGYSDAATWALVDIRLNGTAFEAQFGAYVNINNWTYAAVSVISTKAGSGANGDYDNNQVMVHIPPTNKNMQVNFIYDRTPGIPGVVGGVYMDVRIVAFGK